MQDDIKNIKYGDLVQTSILKYFFQLFNILSNIFYTFMKLFIDVTVEIEILYYISKKIINYYDKEFY